MRRFAVGQDPWDQWVVCDLRAPHDSALAVYTAAWAAHVHAAFLNLANWLAEAVGA